jgi:pectate lyase
LLAMRFNSGLVSAGRFILWPAIVLCGLAACGIHAADATADNQARLKIVTEFAGHVLIDAVDRDHDPRTPLLANGVNVYTKEQLEWMFPSGRKAVLSDLTVQQNLLRVLTGLTNLTGEPKYKTAAKAELAYYFAHFQDAGGLLDWGGHKFVDLRTLTPVGFAEKNGVHELKNVFPFYELMYETDPAATVKFITAFWNAHIYNWRTLEVSRHGEYGHPLRTHWDEAFDDPAPYFETK